MNSPPGQSVAASAGQRHTRQRLLRAAAELIAELGWDRVTTRAVAHRAGLPHGTVSYHFPGKQNLLTEAALDTVADLAPLEQLQGIGSLAELMTTITGWAGDRNARDPVAQGVLREGMRECERNPILRARMATLLADYRRVLSDLLHAEQQRGTILAGPAPSALAALIAAAGDGMLLHALVDDEFDAVAALEALGTLLNPQQKP